MIPGRLGDAPVSGGWCGGREPEEVVSPDGASRRRAGPAPTGPRAAGRVRDIRRTEWRGCDMHPAGWLGARSVTLPGPWSAEISISSAVEQSCGVPPEAADQLSEQLGPHHLVLTLERFDQYRRKRTERAPGCARSNLKQASPSRAGRSPHVSPGQLSKQLAQPQTSSAVGGVTAVRRGPNYWHATEKDRGSVTGARLFRRPEKGFLRTAASVSFYPVSTLYHCPNTPTTVALCPEFNSDLRSLFLQSATIQSRFTIKMECHILLYSAHYSPQYQQ